MSIRPIDMQTMIPQIEKIDAARNKAINKVDSNLQQNQIQTKAETNIKSNQVVNLKQKDQGAVKNDDRDKSKQQAKEGHDHSSNDGEDSQTEPQKATKKILRGHFDMKV